MTKRKIVLIIGFIIILAFSAVVVYGEKWSLPDEAEQKYSDYKYPNWVKTKTDFLFEENRVMTEEEIHEDFLHNCWSGTANSRYLDPRCVETIVDAKLKPINEKLDYLVWCETSKPSKFDVTPNMSLCKNTFEEWKENKQ